MKRFRKVYLELSNICNKNCSFCVKSPREKYMSTLEEVYSRLEKVAEVTDHVYLHILGEPLLYPNLKEVLERCFELKLEVHIVTNGTLLEKQAQTLLNAKALRRISISLHDAESIAEAKETLSNIKAIFDARNGARPRLDLRIWNKQSSAEPEFYDTVLQEIFKTWGHDKIELTPQSRFGTLIAEGVSVHISSPFVWPSLSAPFVSDNGFCMGLRDQIGVLSNGNVVPCCLDSDGEIILGNIDSSNFEEIISSDRFKNMYNGFSNRHCTEELCKHCMFRLRFDCVK